MAPLVNALLQAFYFGFAVPSAKASLALASLRSAKAKHLRAARRIPFPSREPPRVRVWFHTASLGEFEQARPIIEDLRERGASVWVSFFSPSGLEHARGYAHAVDMFYLPLSRRELARTFQVVAPQVVVVVRWDLWPGLVWEAAARGVPVLLVNATLREGSRRTSPWLRPWHRSFYGLLSGVAAVDEADAARLRALCGDEVPVMVLGDSRYDRVWHRVTTASSLGTLDEVLGSAPRPLLVVGSSYEQDERVLAAALRLLGDQAPASVAVVPHEPTEDRVRHCEHLFAALGWAPKRASSLGAGEPWRMVIVDRVGVLAEAYRHADYVVVGGSFKGKVHNVMEPAAWGKPIVVGPHFANSPEALAMRAADALVSVADGGALASTLRRWREQPEEARTVGSRALQFLQARLGASRRIADMVWEKLGERLR